MDSDKRKTKGQLINELDDARNRIRELEKYTVIDKSGDGIAIIQNGLIKFANSTASEIYGFPVEEIFSKPFINYIAPPYRENIQEMYSKRLRGEQVPEKYETVLLNNRGNEIPVEINASYIEYDGRPATLAVVRDISERKKHTESLKASEEKFRTIFNNSSDGIVVYFLDDDNQPGHFIEVNETFCEWLGYTREELKGFSVNDVTNFERDPLPLKDTMLKLRRESKVSAERILRAKNGQEIQVEINAHLINYQGKDLVITLLRNIEARKKAEDSLRDSEQKFKTLAEKSPNMVFINQAGKIVYANRLCEEIMGYSLAELYDPGFDFLKLVADEHIAETKRNFTRHASGHDIPPVEYTFVTKSGRRIECILSTKLIHYTGSQAILGVVTDISNRKLVEEELKFQASLLDASLDTIIAHDLDGNLKYVNDSACCTFGYTREEMLNMNLGQIADTETARLIGPRLRDVAEKGKASFEVTNRRKDGSEVYREIHDSLLNVGDKQYVVGIGHDITDKKRMQSQLIMQDRLASIGQFVSGIAHELNNPLTSVIGFSELLLQKDLPEIARGDLKIINDEAKRTSTIVRNLLTFARQHPQDKQPVLISDPIRAVLQIRYHEQRVNNISVETNFAPDLPLVTGNDSQLQQVFFNLVTNAEFAITDSQRKGIITISTEHLTNFVRVTFKDDGPGISAENMKRLFSPFFTTKEPGKGTGLGLSICQGIIAEHGGRIWAESEPGKGAAFFVELPVSNNL